MRRGTDAQTDLRRSEAHAAPAGRTSEIRLSNSAFTKRKQAQKRHGLPNLPLPLLEPKTEAAALEGSAH